MKKKLATDTAHTLAGLALTSETASVATGGSGLSPGRSPRHEHRAGDIALQDGIFRTANSAVAEVPDALVLACASTANALPEQLADGWHVLAPFGEFPEPGGRYVQVFGADQASAMIRSWNSIPSARGPLNCGPGGRVPPRVSPVRRTFCDRVVGERLVA
jgi:hypothetical protein